MKKAEEIFNILVALEKEKQDGVSAVEISGALNIHRANVSRILNYLYKENKLQKTPGRPVLYHSVKVKTTAEDSPESLSNLDRMVGAGASLQVAIQQAKAAVLYPPRGLHTLLLGETGVGKSMFAESMYFFAMESGIISKDTPFISFNCADYADNPQLVLGQIFGVKKGAFTGAEKDKEGLLKKADGGILFLDEVHRLSPQGQEMLFMFMDKGYFRPLGETEKPASAQVQIIAATTEDPQSSLLRTFVRRIPVAIILPLLRERGLTERYKLIEFFIKEETKRVGKSIYITKNSLISFLCYDPPGNIGQLRSDIQLACAKAFLNYKSQKEKYILISQSDLPYQVKKGTNKQRYREELKDILENKKDILRFYFQNDESSNLDENYQSGKDFYDVIAEKLAFLKNSGMDEREINQTLTIDIESYFQKYIGNLPPKIKREEIAKVVDKKLMEVVDQLLDLANNKLDRQFDEKIYFGLALHLQASIQRIKRGSKIYNPKLNFFRANYPDEFLVAMEIANVIDREFNIETPLDEIGYLTMFLSPNYYHLEGNKVTKVGVLVIMHGNTTSSSMVQVANSLVGVEHAAGINLPLSLKPEEIYVTAKEQVEKLDEGKGVILLVDMGSLVNFGDMIYVETGRIVKTVDKASTPQVVDACRKAVLGRDLEEIYSSCREIITPAKAGFDHRQISNKNIIITACFTGEGAADQLKEVLSAELKEQEGLEIISLNILNRKEFLAAVQKTREEHKLLAIVGTVDISVDNIPFIPAVEVLAGNGIERIKKVVEAEAFYVKIGESLKEHITRWDAARLVEDVREIVEEIEQRLEVQIASDVKIGIILHMCFMVEKLGRGSKRTVFKDLKAFANQYSRELLLIKESIKPLEAKYRFIVQESELAFLCRMFLFNNPGN